MVLNRIGQKLGIVHQGQRQIISLVSVKWNLGLEQILLDLVCKRQIILMMQNGAITVGGYTSPIIVEMMFSQPLLITVKEWLGQPSFITTPVIDYGINFQFLEFLNYTLI